MRTQVSELEVWYNSRGNPTFRIELWHDGLKKHRVIRGPEKHVVLQKARLQREEWDDRWARMYARASMAQRKEERKALAEQLTANAQAALDALNRILQDTLSVNDAIDWDSLKDFSPYPIPKPQRVDPASVEGLKPPPKEPTPDRYKPRITLLDRLIPSRRERKVREANERFHQAHRQWEQARGEYERALAALEEQYLADIEAWELLKREYEDNQRTANGAVDQQRERYLRGDPDAIVDYCDLVLSRSNYPDFFPKEFELQYNTQNKILVVDYQLPPPDALPRLKEVRYIQSRDEMSEKYISDSEAAKLYDGVIYQVVLRTIHELFEADVINALDSVVFNGWVTSIDRATGNVVNACLVSLQTSKKEFLTINLAQVDPKACFKALKGVGSSKLHSLAPIAPIIQVQREDARFVSARGVADSLEDSVNLAAMDWEDFEHLIRELFEKEFSLNGGEVKITQASRDGGVDAVAFDPDPIRGGKIVIQAKRYTNTVGVAAVRDLYGTVLNEGANKGILVTTSDYGPDAYAFARGKPLTLLNGANLLHMLQKHGHKARIDIAEAKAVSRSS